MHVQCCVFEYLQEAQMHIIWVNTNLMVNARESFLNARDTDILHITDLDTWCSCLLWM